MITVKQRSTDPDFTPWGNVGLNVWIHQAPAPNLVFWGYNNNIEVESFDPDQLKYLLSHFGLFETVFIKTPNYNKLTVFLDYD